MTVMILTLLVALILLYLAMKRQIFKKELQLMEKKLTTYAQEPIVQKEGSKKREEAVEAFLQSQENVRLTGVHFQWKGKIRLHPAQKSWLEAQGKSTVIPYEGYLTHLRTGPFPMAFRGADYLYEEDGGRDLALFDLFPLIKNFDRDTKKSHVAELTILSALTVPGFFHHEKIRWSVNHEHELVASFEMLGEVVTLHLGLDDDKNLHEVWLNRWERPAPQEKYTWIPFGVRVGRLEGDERELSFYWYFRSQEERAAAQWTLQDLKILGA